MALPMVTALGSENTSVPLSVTDPLPTVPTVEAPSINAAPLPMVVPPV